MTNDTHLSPTPLLLWTPRFEAIFEKAGMNLNDPLNKIRVLEHYGPHPEQYHQLVHDRLIQSTDRLTGEAYKKALENELRDIRKEITTPGSKLNELVTQ